MNSLNIGLVIFVLLSVVIHLLLVLHRTAKHPPPHLIRGTVAKVSYNGAIDSVVVKNDDGSTEDFIDFDGDPVEDFKVGDRVVGAALCWLQHEKRR